MCRQSFRNEVPAARNLALSCPLNRLSLFHLVRHRRRSFRLLVNTLFLAAIHSTPGPLRSGAPCTLPRSSTVCSVQAEREPLGSFGSVAAHIAIGFMGQLHRHSGVVRRSGHRQRMARPVCKRVVVDGAIGLHQRNRPQRHPPCRDGDPRARLLTRYTVSWGPLPVCRFVERRSAVRPSFFTPLADFVQPNRLTEA